MTDTTVPVRSTSERRSTGEVLLFCLFVGGFIATLAFFALVDVYDRHFFERSYATAYNGFRLAFVAYFFWLVYVVGRLTLSLVARGSFAGLPMHERLALGFFVGAAALTAVMLVLGYLGLYWRAVAFGIAVPIIAASWRHFVALASEARSSIARHVREGSRVERTLSIVMVVAAAFAGAALLLVKGLYPQGGHDYYQHYSHFYAAVIDDHGIWPNLFWYQYYLSKGMGVTFLGMLLTDALAPSLVAYCFAVATALAVYSLVKGFGSRSLWPWLAVVLYLALNVHTLGTGDYAMNGGWGHFQKPHELNSPVLVAILWMSVGMVRATGDLRRVWWFSASACAFVVAYILLVSPLIVGLFAILAAFFFLTRSRELAGMFFGIAVATGVGLASLLVLNYVTTGAPADVAPQAWWPIVDLRRLRDEGMLFDFVEIALIRARGVVGGSVMTDDFSLVDYVRNLFRLDILGLMVGAALLAALAGLIVRDVRRSRSVDVGTMDTQSRQACGVIAAFFLATAMFAFTLGMLESVSFVRISSFQLPLVIAATAIVGQVATAGLSGRIRSLTASVAPVVLLSLSLIPVYAQHPTTLLAVFHNALRFVGGSYSVYDAYRDQAGWPALHNGTAIYPGMYEAWKKVGPGKRIWSFHIQTYCMLPGCHVESMPASSMTRFREEILFGSPESAKQILRREGLNYFFISTRLPVVDVLQCTPLFSPDTMQHHLDVAWTDGRDVLLTWKGQGGDSLSPEWLERYRNAIKPNRYVPECGPEAPAFAANGRHIAQEIAKGKRWGADIALPK